MAKKVLIIDDNREDALKLFKPFEELDIVPVSAKSAYEALDLIYKDVPDLILSDILMPEMGGYEFCRMIKADDLTKNIPVIVYSQLSKNIDKFWAYRSGADGFVNKEQALEELLNTSIEFIKNMPVSIDVKGKILSSKTHCVRDEKSHLLTKNELIREFNTIVSFDGDADLLPVRIFGLIHRYFKYDCALLCFKDDNKLPLVLLDSAHVELGKNVCDEIKELISPDKKEAVIKTVLEKEKTVKIERLSDFNLRYEYEITLEGKDGGAIGHLHLYAKDNLSSYELRLSNIIKDMVEHIVRLRYFKNVKDKNVFDKNPKKLYSQLDFDRILSYECDWHKRNESPLYLAFMEIETLDEIKNNYGNEYADVLLAKISNLLNECLSDGEFVYRGEDDVFSILMTNSEAHRTQSTLEAVSMRIQDKGLSTVNEDNNVRVKIGALKFSDKYKNHYEYINALYEVLDEARQGRANIVLR